MNLWYDWLWNVTSGDMLYGWEDGFLYYLGEREGLYTLKMDFVNNMADGLLDFQILSWSNQQELVGPPIFRADPLINPLWGTIEEKKYFVGSEWDTNPGTSMRFIGSTIEAKNHMYLVPGGKEYINTFRFGLAVSMLDSISTPGTTDIAIMLNLTKSCSSADGFDNMRIINSHLDVYAPIQCAKLEGVEYNPEGRSVRGPQKIIMKIGTTMIAMFAVPVFGQAAGSFMIFGAAIGEEIFDYFQDQPVSGITTEISEDGHHRLRLSDNLLEKTDFVPANLTATDIVYMKVHSSSGSHCGAFKIVFNGTLQLGNTLYIPGQPGHPPTIIFHWYSVADITTTIYFPWFVITPS